MAANSDDASSHRQTSSDENNTRGRSKKRRRTQILGQSRKEIRAGTRNRDKEVKASIANASIEWGSYDLGFLTSGLEGEKELYDFLKRLEKVSTFARIGADTTAKLLSMLRKGSKLDMISGIQSELPSLRQDDIIFLTDAKSLKDTLSQPFQVPLLHRVTTSHPRLSPSINFSIQEFLGTLAREMGASISVYDYSIQDPTKRTRRTTLDELISCFCRENTCRTALNFLDIENRSGIQFCPLSITLQNIMTRLNALTQYDKGKTGSEWKAEPAKEFFLASKKNSISTIHL
ncbi:MAG: hypothetical protein M1840_002192 [Geoglossum simile]|nr:MAG: hypothetical protein M1840_002192 [Geoglossum simile]